MDGSDDSRETRISAGAHLGLEASPAHEFGRKLTRWAQKNRWQLAFLWVPTALVAIYYFLIAADLYASQAEFIVRSPQHQQMPSLTSLLQGSGVARAQDEIYSVNDFLLSRDAVKSLEKDVDLRAIFNRREGDWLARYPSAIYDRSDEDFYKYYKRRVEVDYDTTTGITTITVKAFNAPDAQKLANLLIQESEALVNRLNLRAHDNAVRDAEADVKLAEDHVITAGQDMLGYRTREATLDPTKSSGAVFEAIGKVEAELASAQTEVAETIRASPDSPLKTSQQTHVEALQQQLRSMQANMAGRGGDSIALKLPEYEQLLMRQEFTSKELGSALASLESARAEARRQQVYLDRVVEPNLPDKAEYPKRLISVGVVFISLFIAYSIGALLLAGVREHAQE